MSGVKAQSDAIRRRLDLLVVLFNPYSEEALTYGLFASAIGDTEDAVRKWYQRGSIPPKGARRIVEAAYRLGLQGVTFEWVLTGKGSRPKKGQAPGEPSESGADEVEDEGGEGSFLDYTLRTTRHLAAAEQEGATPGVQLRILELAEEIGVEQFGKRAKAFIERERQRIQRGERLGAGGSQ
jgi:hypothetical protein